MNLIRHPYDSASCMELSWDPEAHELLGEYPWLAYLRRRTNTPRLMVYHHKITGAFVLGIWIWSPQEAQTPLICEVKNFRDTPRRLWPRDLPPPNVLGQILQPVEKVVEQRRKNREIAAYRKAREKEELAESKQDAINHYLHRGMAAEARELARSPWRKPSEEVADFMRTTREMIAKEGF